MTALTFDNPVFITYAIAAALMVLKIMGQGWMTVYRMMKSNAGLVNPEDLRATPLNPDPRPEQLDLNDYVDRSRRMHRNDLENIPAFLAIGLIFVIAAPPGWLASLLLYGFVAARLAHAAAYLTAQNHEVRASFYTIGSLFVIAMALFVLWAALV
ncbi:glutathione S-transferase [Salinihabitans flavidus]|uniref:Microsomal glutathione S-transferase 1 n=1 Tax=Salinihabitans flavidus TaxID=569882 RepID=A0A1H8RD42_9RHOB|nr:MAPEG family protein [Salinihabitans flavidus]SEO64340.1 glutathione S-transferase [Salinihabitans flavidus]